MYFSTPHSSQRIFSSLSSHLALYSFCTFLYSRHPLLKHFFFVYYLQSLLQHSSFPCILFRFSCNTLLSLVFSSGTRATLFFPFPLSLPLSLTSLFIFFIPSLFPLSPRLVYPSSLPLYSHSLCPLLFYVASSLPLLSLPLPPLFTLSLSSSPSLPVPPPV